MVILGKHDVLLGRKKRSHGHPGNRLFRELIQAFRQEYQESRVRRNKNAIVIRILETISSRGGKFLKYNEEDDNRGWYEVCEQDSYAKVSHALRSAKASRDSPSPDCPESAPEKVQTGDFTDLHSIIDDVGCRRNKSTRCDLSPENVVFPKDQPHTETHDDYEPLKQDDTASIFECHDCHGFDDESIKILASLFQID